MNFPKSIIQKFESIATNHYGMPISKNPLGILREYCENDKYYGVKYYHEEFNDEHNILEQGEGYIIGEYNILSKYIYLNIAINKLTGQVIIKKNKK